MTDKQNKIVGCVLIGGVLINTFISLNLLRQVGDHEYEISRQNSDIQQLSQKYWEIRDNNYNGGLN